MKLLLALLCIFGTALTARAETLVWSDDFSEATLNPARWTALTGRRDSAWLRPESARTEEGLLKIRTTTENSVHSTAFLMTKNLFETRYGYFEARIKFYSTPGAWCAFWLQSNSIGNPLGDPALAGVEADIVEHRAVDENGRDLRNAAVMNLHWDGYTDHHKRVGSAYTPVPGAPPLQGHWHTYGMRWTPAGYTFYLDGVEQWNSRQDPQAVVSQHAQHLRLTCEVRDRSWAGNIPAAGYGSIETSQTGMDVDWVRVWQ